MAIGDYSDFKIYNDEFQGGVVDVLSNNIDAFNSSSNGALVMADMTQEGHYSKEAFFDRVADMVTRQDITSVSSVTPLDMTQDEFIGVKCHGKIGPVAVTRKQFKLIGEDPKLFSFLLGKQAGEDMLQYMLNFALAAATGALGDQSDLCFDATGESTKTMIVEHLIDGMAKRGDKAQEIAAWVGHSKPFYNLVKAQAGLVSDRLAGATIYEGSVGTLGRPFVVADNDYLKVSGSPNTYYTLGLVPGAVAVEISEPLDVNFEGKVSGYEQLLTRYQGEWGFTLHLRGCQYDTTVDINPTIANINLTGTWDKVVASVKNMLGVRVKTQ